MVQQIIIGTEYRPIKFHGMVKHMVFECNTCHEQFAKPESYYRKQMKRRTNVCCFCSPRCRTIFMTGKMFSEKRENATPRQTPQASAQHDRPGSFGSLFHKLFSK